MARHLHLTRARLTLGITAALATFFAVHVFVLHHEYMGHGFELTAVPLIDRLIGFCCGVAEAAE